MDGQDWMTPVRNQGRCGSCVAFAALAAVEGAFNIAVGQPDYDINLSEQYLFSRIGSCARGAMVSTSGRIMRNEGAPDEACYPYISGRSGVDQPASRACSERRSRAIFATGFQGVSAANLKRALLRGPVMTTMTVYEDFSYYTGGVYRYVSGRSLGGHAVTIVGYNDADQAWIVKNSWGENWGEQGYFRIYYNDRSGVGRNNYIFSVQPATNLVKLDAPTHLSAVSGTVDLHASYYIRAKGGHLGFSLINRGNHNERLDGEFDAGRSNTFIDSHLLSDGMYELRLTDTALNGVHPWYTNIIIANHEPAISLEMVPGFDNRRPVRDRVNFNIRTMSDGAPLTQRSGRNH